MPKLHSGSPFFICKDSLLVLPKTCYCVGGLCWWLFCHFSTYCNIHAVTALVKWFPLDRIARWTTQLRRQYGLNLRPRRSGSSFGCIVSPRPCSPQSSLCKARRAFILYIVPICQGVCYWRRRGSTIGAGVGCHLC